jgi:glycosyltransferase involved in cell wall biosynthesis
MIAILFPVFNTAAYLPACLDSVLAQVEEDWELVAVDDFSTDDSPYILKEYARQDRRIRIVQNDKKGIAPALQMAFRQSTGSFITRMDSDDRMLPQKLACLKKILLENGTGHIATGLVKYFSDDGVGEGYRRYATWLNGLALQGCSFHEIYRECTIPSPCWMAWRTDLERCGAFMEEVYPEDYDLAFRFRQAGFKVASCPEVLHEWRDSPGRTSRTNELYLDNSYLDLKTDWFFRTDYVPTRPLVLWGAGHKGKRLSGLFTARGVSFRWVCDNAGKWGHRISGVKMESYEILADLPDAQIVIAVAAPDGQRQIMNFLESNKFERGKHYFWFC